MKDAPAKIDPDAPIPYSVTRLGQTEITLAILRATYTGEARRRLENDLRWMSTRFLTPAELQEVFDE